MSKKMSKTGILGLTVALLVILSSFPATALHGGLSFTEDSQSITIYSGNLTTQFYKSTPEIVFFNTQDGGENARFSIKYDQIICFNDSGDGIIDLEETKYTAALSDFNWQTSRVVSGEKEDTGAYIEFTISSEIDVSSYSPGEEYVEHGVKPGMPGSQITQTPPTGKETVDGWAEIKFYFTITEKDVERSVDSSNYIIKGETEVKIDIEIIIQKELDISNIAIGQRLNADESEEKTHEYRLHEPEGIRDYTDMGSVAYRYEYMDAPKQEIGFAQVDGEEQGFYSWTSSFESFYADGSKKTLEVETSYLMNEGLHLFFSYPYDAGVEILYHDPSFGIIAEAFEKAVVYIMDHVYSFTMGIVIALGVVSSWTYLKVRSEGKKEERILDLKSNTYYRKKGK